MNEAIVNQQQQPVQQPDQGQPEQRQQPPTSTPWATEAVSVPESPDGYTLEVKDADGNQLDWADPQMDASVRGWAHSAGISQGDLNLVAESAFTADAINATPASFEAELKDMGLTNLSERLEAVGALIAEAASDNADALYDFLDRTNLGNNVSLFLVLDKIAQGRMKNGR